MSDSQLLPFHPLADIFPLIEGAEFDELVADIRDYGLREPIVMHDGMILDGRNRYRACLQSSVTVHFRKFEGDDPVAFVVSLNLRRRHLDESQRALVAARLATLPQGARTDLAPIGARSQGDAADLLNVGRRSVQRAKDVLDQGAPELVKAVETGKASVSAAAAIATLPEPEQQEIVARGEKEITEAAKIIWTRRAEAKRAKNAALKAATPNVIPTGKFSVIVIDPPWPVDKIQRVLRPNQTAIDYPTMTETEIEAFPLQVMAADDCHLFCWTVARYLPFSLRLVELWGFRYVLPMVWHKPGGFQPLGLPQYNAEFIIYARRGAPEFVDTKAFPICFNAQRREHSRKPDGFYDIIRRVTAGPRVDVFSREPREGFDQLGNETSKFAAD
jgi:N6-adenosine-specific RNA methylase IME4